VNFLGNTTVCYENDAKPNFVKEMQGFLMSNQIVHVIRKLFRRKIINSRVS